MKKFCCLIIVLTFVAYSFAQEEEHLTFKNIPISGSISSFISKMKEAGFTLVEQIDDGAIMKGSFVGYSDCSVFVFCSSSSKTVWKVVAQLPSQSSWSSVKSRYRDFKEKYTTKYGEPFKNFEFFTDSYYEGDGYELQAMKLEKGYYSTYWKTERGFIVVSIDASSNSNGWVRLAYEDKEGVEIKRNELSAIVDDDI